MIFPEGTRSKDGELRNFKDGAFHIALKSEIGILPIVLDNTNKAIFKEGLLQGHVNMHLKILPEIPYSDIQHLSPKEIGAIVHDLIKNERNKMQENY